MEGSPSPKSARGKRRKRSRGSKRSRHQRSKSTDSTVSQLTSESSDAIILNHLQRKSSAGELVNDAELLAEVVQHGEAMEEQGVKSQSVGEDSVRLVYDVSAWRDRGFAVAFVLHLGFLVFLAAQFGEEAVRDGAFAVDQEDSEGDSPFHYNTRSLAAMVVMSCAVASAFGFVWVGVMRHSPGVVLKTGVWLFLVLSVVIVTLLFVFDAAVVALFYLLVVLFISLYLYVVRRRIPFAEAALNVSLQALHTNAGPFKAVAAMLVLQVMWLVFWAFTMVSVVHQGAGSLSIFGVLSFYWTQQVLFNVAHATTAGSVASFWYVPESPDPTWHSFRRATSTSFGSICQGSLLVSVLKSIRFVVRLGHSSHDRHGGMFTGVSLAILQCVDTLVRYFNEYAFAYVAVYGYSYGRSAQLTFDLIHDRGFDMLINDDLTSFAIFFGSFASGTLSACVAIVWTKAFELDSFVLFFVLSFVIGYTTCSLLLSPVSSAISTTFLIWADDSAVMNDTHHEYFDVLRLAANKMHNSDMMWDARTGGFTDAHGNALEGV